MIMIALVAIVREKADGEAIMVMTTVFNPSGVMSVILGSLSAGLHAGECEQTNGGRGSKHEDFRAHGISPSIRCGILTSSLPKNRPVASIPLADVDYNFDMHSRD
jgi:hypothetical protein